MSSGTHERAFKLFASLFGLLLGDKRHLESVCAVLQRLVFERIGWPKHKNWPAICELGRYDHLMAIVVATLDLEHMDEHTECIVAAFPECFSETETHGRVSLSLLRVLAQNKASSDPTPRKNPGDYPMDYRVIPAWIPTFQFFKFGVGSRAGLKDTRLPLEINPSSPQGSIVTWEGRQFVVIENDFPCEEITLVPAECIDVNA